MSSIVFAPMWVTMPDGSRVPARPRLDAPRTLVVADDRRQVEFWTTELRLLQRMLPHGARDPSFTHKDDSKQTHAFCPPLRWLTSDTARQHLPHLDGYDEVWFVGTWASVDSEALARVHVGALYSKAHVTYVCDPYGQVIAPQLTWTCWDAPSTGKRTKWHLVAPSGFASPGDYRSMCGLPLTGPQLEADGYWEDERYGPPRDACGICAHDAWQCVIPLRMFDEGHEVRMEYWAKRLEEQRRDLGRLAARMIRSKRATKRVIGYGKGRAGDASTSLAKSWYGRDSRTDPRNPYRTNR